MAISLTKKITTIFKLLREPKILSSLISFRAFGYLLETGWFNSFKSGNPIDNNLKPIPWFTYSVIDFLKSKVNSNLSVLEFGSGNSTFFFADKSRAVISLEHNKEWYEKILSKAPENIKLIYTSSENADVFLSPLTEIKNKFDVIVVDSIFRNECIKGCLNYLTEQGIILLDDSERSEYNEGIAFAMKHNFKRLDFSGIAPGIFFRKCTSVFYKDNNCLGI